MLQCGHQHGKLTPAQHLPLQRRKESKWRGELTGNGVTIHYRADGTCRREKSRGAPQLNLNQWRKTNQTGDDFYPFFFLIKHTARNVSSYEAVEAKM